MITGEKLLGNLAVEYHADPRSRSHFENIKGPYPVVHDTSYKVNNLYLLKGGIKSELLPDCNSAPCAGRMGGTQALNRMLLLYYWNDTRRSIRTYDKCCRVCHQTKRRNYKPFCLLQPTTPPKSEWQLISME